MKKDKFNTILIIIFAIIVGLISYLLLFDNKKEVVSVTLNSKSISIFVGDNKKIDVSIIPENADNKTLIWASSNDVVATVSDGIITGNSEGVAIITVKSENSNVSDSCYVRVVKKEATKFSIIDSNIELRINESKVLYYNIEPVELSSLVTWISSDERIATVDNNGKITGVSNGKTTIKGMYGDKEIICNVKVVIPVDSLNISKTNTTIKINQTEQLQLTILPTTAINQDITWESNNTNVVTVDNGTIKGISEGEAIVSASVDGKRVSCFVTVTIPVDSIKLNKTSLSLKKNNSETLTATISPSNVTNKKITWTSSNPNVAKVDSNGKVTSAGNGKAIITASVDGVNASCNITSIGYIVTQDGKFGKYKTTATYNSETFKYSIKTGNADYVLVWVLDAYKQFNSALPSLGNVYSADNLLSKEINKYGYQKKGMVATNGSFFWAGWGDSPALPLIINKGRIIRDIDKNGYSGKNIHSTFGITKDGLIKTYKFYSHDYNLNLATKEEMLKDGIRNNFAYAVDVIDSKGNVTTDLAKDKRTILCQIDENNFVIYSGSSLNFHQIGVELKNNFGCKSAYNLDGGGSRKLYYKGSTNTLTKITGGDRYIPDMMYFVEQ
jgi:uncharacterized protein YjdB